MSVRFSGTAPVLPGLIPTPGPPPPSERLARSSPAKRTAGLAESRVTIVATDDPGLGTDGPHAFLDVVGTLAVAERR